MKIAIGNDHAGPELNKIIVDFLKEKKIEVVNFGTKIDQRVDYPDYAHKVAEAVSSSKVDLGILICGSGNGIAMSANKHAAIRAALCWNIEIAKLAKAHNNANVISLPARFINSEMAIEIIEAFLDTEFEGGRHQLRIEKISFC